MSIREGTDPELFARVQEQNLLRQYDLLTNCIEIGLVKGIEAFDKYTLWSLNHTAVNNIAQFGGRFRDQPIYVNKHIPPHFKDVPNLMDQCLSLVHENWDASEHPTYMAAFMLWRLNWVHPFIEGNGRTARAACYYLLCMKAGGLLPGKKIVPERIREDRKPYYLALQTADQKWSDGHLDVWELAHYLEHLLIRQLQDDT